MTALRLPRVKVCGVQTTEDLGAAIPLGLEAIGLVDHPRSPRAITPARARTLVDGLPAGLLAVGVFVDRPPAYVAAWLDEAGGTAAQLCGSEEPGDWRELPYPILRRIAVDETGAAEIARWERVAQGFVLDRPGTPGGSGLEVELELAAELASRVPCLLAGGLAADNVAARIAHVHPGGVDASSRLESSPGHKDPRKVEAFVRAAAVAFSEVPS